MGWLLRALSMLKFPGRVQNGSDKPVGVMGWLLRDLSMLKFPGRVQNCSDKPVGVMGWLLRDLSMLKFPGRVQNGSEEPVGAMGWLLRALSMLKFPGRVQDGSEEPVNVKVIECAVSGRQCHGAFISSVNMKQVMVLGFLVGLLALGHAANIPTKEENPEIISPQMDGYTTMKVETGMMGEEPIMVGPIMVEPIMNEPMSLDKIKEDIVEMMEINKNNNTMMEMTEEEQKEMPMIVMEKENKENIPSMYMSGENKGDIIPVMSIMGGNKEGSPAMIMTEENKEGLPTMVMKGDDKEDMPMLAMMDKEMPIIMDRIDEVPMMSMKDEMSLPMKGEITSGAPTKTDKDIGMMNTTATTDQYHSVREETGRSSSSFVDSTAADVIKRIYKECVQQGSFSCIKPKVLSFLSSAVKKDKILLTEDLVIEKTAKYLSTNDNYEKWSNQAVPVEDVLERVDEFLSSHQLKVRVPKEIVSGAMLPFVPNFLVQNIPGEVVVPLADNSPSSGQERGFIKKIVIPFLLGLKFKATALIPIALALIALKTWKALTLGLLSLVMSGALVIFKFTKPKVVNYEVYHYPHHPAPVVEHTAPTSYEHHGWGRGLDAQSLAYSAYTPL
ncbi:unnamed protein product [Timema podura]|uniref:Osiris 18 n=1 Tax=Timema podura TaxID=61482 RepID=A0ABN7NGX7_TIMPD|nr:unnamed protein product [Timema podura]